MPHPWAWNQPFIFTSHARHKSKSIFICEILPFVWKINLLWHPSVCVKYKKDALICVVRVMNRFFFLNRFISHNREDVTRWIVWHESPIFECMSRIADSRVWQCLSTCEWHCLSTNVSKETYIREKRPTKETYILEKRPAKETYIHETRASDAHSLCWRCGVWHGLLTCATCLIRTWDMKRDLKKRPIYMKRDLVTHIHYFGRVACGIAYSHVQHASFVRGTWLIHTRDMTHAYMQYNITYICICIHMYTHAHTHTHTHTHRHMLTHTCQLLLCEYDDKCHDFHFKHEELHKLMNIQTNVQQNHKVKTILDSMRGHV